MISQNISNIVGKFLNDITIPSDARVMRETTFTPPEQGSVKAIFAPRADIFVKFKQKHYSVVINSFLNCFLFI